MPKYEYSLCFKYILRFDDHFLMDFTLMRDVCNHIVNVERLTHVVFVVRIWHGSEVDRHHCSTLHVAKLVKSCRRVAVSIEEFCNRGPILREIRVIKSLVILLVVVNDVPCF